MSNNHFWKIRLPMSSKEGHNYDSTSNETRNTTRKVINHMLSAADSELSSQIAETEDTLQGEDDCLLEIEGASEDEEVVNKKQRRALKFL